MNASTLPRARAIAVAVWKGGLRELLPWIAAAALAWFLALHWAPSRWCALRRNLASASRLSDAAPRPEVLSERLSEASADSAAAARLRAFAASRQAGGSDPSSRVASRVVPRLEGAGLELQRVSAREEGGEVLLSLSVAGGWRSVGRAVTALDSMPEAWTARRLTLRPVDGNRLAGDFVVAVPVSPEGAR